MVNPICEPISRIYRELWMGEAELKKYSKSRYQLGVPENHRKSLKRSSGGFFADEFRIHRWQRMDGE